MEEKVICIVTPDARTYYKATCVAKEFLDKDQNIINKTGAIPDGEIVEFSATTATVKHFANEKLHGRLEVLDLNDNSVTFSEEYEQGQLVRVTEHTIPPQPLAAVVQSEAATYPGTILKTSKDARAFYVDGKQIAQETLSSNGATLELLGNIPDGEVKEFAENGKLRSQSYYVNNKRHGLVTYYDEQDRVVSAETYEQGVLQGPAQYHSYTQHDDLTTKCSYKNAVLDGEFVVTQHDGTVREQAQYSNGRLHGERRTYYANGKDEAQENYTEGKLSGKRTLFFPSGEVWYTENYTNGRLDGERTEFFPNGQIYINEFYSDGMLDGPRNLYAPDGNLITSEEYHWGNVVHNTEMHPL